MKIINLIPKNPTLKIKAVNLDFSSTGIHLIIGDTGSGKTSIIKQILFDAKTKELEFESKQEEELFKNKKSELISYVPQEVLDYEEIVDSYLNLDRLKDRSQLDKYLSSFNLDKNLLEVSFNKLSGGEKRKLAIIKALLKDTPYIFLDEPTNDMDNAAIASLKEILKFLAIDHTIVIITHDKRLFEISDSSYAIKDTSIEQIENKKNEKFITGDVIERKRGSNLSSYARFSPKPLKTNYFTFVKAIILFSFMLCSFFVGETFLMKHYNTENLPDKNNLFIYSADGTFNELNERYLRENNINIGTNKITKINYSNIPEISKLDDIDKIFYPDAEYLDKISNDFVAKESSTKHIISIPSFLTSGPDLVAFPFDIKGVINGRMPYDFKNEIALSKNMYNQLSGISSDKLVIGSTMNYLGSNYTIVGETNSDIAILAMNLDDSKNSGYHVYSDATFKEISDKSVKFFKDLQFNDYTSVNHILIKTKQSEKIILNRLIKEFPANNFYSYNFAKSFIQNKNRPLYLGGLIASISLGLVLAFIFNLLEKNTLNYVAKIIKDHAYYNMDMKFGVSKYLIDYYKYIVISALSAMIIIWVISIFKVFFLIFCLLTISVYISISCILNQRIFKEVK